MFRAQNFSIPSGPPPPPPPPGNLANVEAGLVNFLNTTTNTVSSSYTVDSGGHCGCYGNGKIFLSQYGTGDVEVRDYVTGTFITDVATGGTFLTGIDYDPVNNRVWVVDFGGAYVINATTNALITTISVTNGWGCYYHDGVFYITAYDFSQTLYAYDADTYTLIESIATGGDYGACIGVGNGKIVIGNAVSMDASIIDLATYDLITTVPLATDAYGTRIGYGDGYFCVPQYTGGNVTFINATTNAVHSSVSTTGLFFDCEYAGGKFVVGSIGGTDLCFFNSTTLTLAATLTRPGSCAGMFKVP